MVVVETIKPIDVSLDQTPQEFVEWYDICLDQTPLESEKSLESSGVKFGSSTDNVEEEGCCSGISEQKEKDEMMNETLNTEGRSLESMTFNSLMSFSTLESSEAMKINYAKESDSSQTS